VEVYTGRGKSEVFCSSAVPVKPKFVYVV